MHNIPEDRTTMLMSPGSQASMTLLLEDVLMNFHITKRWTELQIIGLSPAILENLKFSKNYLPLF